MNISTHRMWRDTFVFCSYDNSTSEEGKPCPGCADTVRKPIPLTEFYPLEELING